TRIGGTRGVMSPRTVSRGSSARAVRLPTMIASYPARSRCVSTRAASPVTRVARPGAAPSRASSESAYLRATYTEPRSTTWKNAAFCARTASASTPPTTSTPARASRSAPPRASGCGSLAPYTRRAMPAASIAAAHGGVLPWCAHGSRVLYSVAPRARSPAAASATASACGSPYCACQPSAITSPSRTTTAPTSGLGCTRPQPRHASPMARRIHSRSAGVGAGGIPRSGGDADGEAAEEGALLGVEANGRQRARHHVPALLPAKLETGGQDQQGEPPVDEEEEPVVREAVHGDRDRRTARVRGVDEAPGDVRRVAVVAGARREADAEQPLPDRAPHAQVGVTVRREPGIRAPELRVAERDVPDAPVHGRDGDAGGGPRPPQDAEAQTGAPGERQVVEPLVVRQEHEAGAGEQVQGEHAPDRDRRGEPLEEADGAVHGERGDREVDVADPADPADGGQVGLDGRDPPADADAREVADPHAQRARRPRHGVAARSGEADARLDDLDTLGDEVAEPQGRLGRVPGRERAPGRQLVLLRGQGRRRQQPSERQQCRREAGAGQPTACHVTPPECSDQRRTTPPVPARTSPSVQASTPAARARPAASSTD